jgi:hypothetical protein
VQPTDYAASASFEHRFWLQIVGDHARFIKDALSPDEVQEIQRARFYIAKLDELLEKSRRELDEAQLQELSRESYTRAQDLRNFKLHLLRRHLTGKIGLKLPPSFLNHMVNEVEEYLRVLRFLVSGQPAPMYNEIHHHLVWLQDAFGHAASISGDLDMAEKPLIETAQSFESHFRDFYLKAVEVAGYMRTNVSKFPALARFNKEVELEMLLFKGFLRELEEMRLTGEVLGVLSPLMADHMAREECYYLTKLSLTAGTKAPECDPGKPRTEG